MQPLVDALALLAEHAALALEAARHGHQLRALLVRQPQRALWGCIAGVAGCEQAKHPVHMMALGRRGWAARQRAYLAPIWVTQGFIKGKNWHGAWPSL